jgi:hypothetical protein
MKRGPKCVYEMKVNGLKFLKTIRVGLDGSICAVSMNAQSWVTFTPMTD